MCDFCYLYRFAMVELLGMNAESEINTRSFSIYFILFNRFHFFGGDFVQKVDKQSYAQFSFQKQI